MMVIRIQPEMVFLDMSLEKSLITVYEESLSILPEQHGSVNIEL